MNPTYNISCSGPIPQNNVSCRLVDVCETLHITLTVMQVAIIQCPAGFIVQAIPYADFGTVPINT